MKEDFTKPDPDLDVFVHAPISRQPVAAPAFRVPVPNYAIDAATNLQDVFAGLAGIVVELIECPAGGDPGRRRQALLDLRMGVDRLYPSSVWPDTTILIGGRFSWELRKQIADRLQDLE